MSVLSSKRFSELVVRIALRPRSRGVGWRIFQSALTASASATERGPGGICALLGELLG